MRVHAEIERVFLAIVCALDEEFSLTTLCDLVQLWRGKALRIETDQLDPGTTGCCLALQDVDLIYTQRGIDSILMQIAILHEIAHLILGHVPLLANGEGTPAYDVFVQRRERTTTMEPSAARGPRRWSAPLHWLRRPFGSRPIGPAAMPPQLGPRAIAPIPPHGEDFVVPTVYDREQEYAAETLATLFFDHLATLDMTIPRTARHLHG